MRKGFMKVSAPGLQGMFASLCEAFMFFGLIRGQRVVFERKSTVFIRVDVVGLPIFFAFFEEKKA